MRLAMGHSVYSWTELSAGLWQQGMNDLAVTCGLTGYSMIDTQKFSESIPSRTNNSINKCYIKSI